MGVSVEAQTFEDSDYVKNVKTVCRISTDRTTSLIKGNDYLYFLTSDCHREFRTVNELHHFTNSIIDSRMTKLGNFVDTPEKNDVEEKDKLTFLDILIKSTVDGKPLAKEDIREEVDTFMFEVSNI